jgi:uncharacterized protein YkwD
VRRARSLLLILTVSAVALAGPAAGSRATATRQAGLDGSLLVQLNALRARHGLAPLRLSPRLSAAADRHSLEMARDGYFAHESANGSAFWKRVQRFYPTTGYRSWAVGENLLWQSPELNAPEAIKLWMASPPHRENLLSRAWREVGVGAVRVESASGPFQGLTVTLVTVDFGARAK